MDNLPIILIGITNLFLVLILGLLIYLVHRLLKHNKNGRHSTDVYHPDVLKRMKQIQEIKAGKSELFCPNHPDETAEVTCAICDRFFCKSCVRPFKTLHFCKEHLTLVMKHEWQEVITIKTSTHDPEEGVRLYDAKKRIFEEKNIPTYIETHYKINIDHDYIETYLVVFSMEDNVQTTKDLLSQ